MESSTFSPYLPLKSNTSIRLVTILPGEFLDFVECRLEYEDELSVELQYKALSYVWVDTAKKIPIKLDGRGFHVTSNLESALRYLRYPQVARRLWVDAICINQADVVERSVQVVRMRTIYRLAQAVLIWLGKESEEPDGEGAEGLRAPAADVFTFARMMAVATGQDSFRSNITEMIDLLVLLRRP
jgi:hypothetical protein